MRRVWFHRSMAALWVLLGIPAVLLWKESVLFVIVASLYANVMSSWSSAEAADDRGIYRRLDKIEKDLG